MRTDLGSVTGLVLVPVRALDRSAAIACDAYAVQCQVMVFYGEAGRGDAFDISRAARNIEHLLAFAALEVVVVPTVRQFVAWCFSRQLDALDLTRFQ